MAFDEVLAAAEQGCTHWLDVELVSEGLVCGGGGGHFDAEVDVFGDVDFEDGDGAESGGGASAEVAGDFGGEANGGGEADALEAVVGGDFFESFEGDGELGAAFVGGELVDLVDDDPLDAAEVAAEAFAGEENLECLWGGDEHVRW